MLQNKEQECVTPKILTAVGSVYHVTTMSRRRSRQDQEVIMMYKNNRMEREEGREIWAVAFQIVMTALLRNPVVAIQPFLDHPNMATDQFSMFTFH